MSTTPKTAAAEALAELLGDPLPPDWQDKLAIEARQGHLGVLAYLAADAIVDVVIRYIDRQARGERLSAGDPPMLALVNSICELDKGWRKYTHKTQRGDAGEIVYNSAAFWAGPTVAAIVEGFLERIREIGRRVIDDALQEAQQYSVALAYPASEDPA
ncbi:MAG: hypothetical protein ACJ8AH_06835 [Stellaceae bacterium]